MKEGDIVVCHASRGYQFTEGKEYTVLEYAPEYYDNTSSSGFTWPAYVTVMDDWGRNATAHAHRFTIKGQQ